LHRLHKVFSLSFLITLVIHFLSKGGRGSFAEPAARQLQYFPRAKYFVKKINRKQNTVRVPFPVLAGIVFFLINNFIIIYNNINN
jgi:hypothetical protein